MLNKEKRNYDEFIKTNKNIKDNPFAQKCENCTTDMWKYLKEKTKDLNKKCSTNTYVWIEKIQDDNENL